MSVHDWLPRAKCRGCGKRYQLRRDSLIRYHEIKGEQCSGSQRRPKRLAARLHLRRLSNAADRLFAAAHVAAGHEPLNPWRSAFEALQTKIERELNETSASHSKGSK